MSACPHCGHDIPLGGPNGGQFRREIQWQIGYDHRHDENPEKRQYGCHGMEIRWLLHGPKATMQFLLYAGWLPTWDWPSNDRRTIDPLPADLGYHADAEQYEGQGDRQCDCRPSGRCFYDGSGLMANDAFKVLVAEGEEALWARLREEYRTRFEETQSTATTDGVKE